MNRFASVRNLSYIFASQYSQKRFGTSIKVILMQALDKKGKRLEVIEVKRGFARNYLIPKQIAGKL